MRSVPHSCVPSAELRFGPGSACRLRMKGAERAWHVILFSASSASPHHLLEHSRCFGLPLKGEDVSESRFASSSCRGRHVSWRAASKWRSLRA